jgi:hypothetical protein
MNNHMMLLDNHTMLSDNHTMFLHNRTMLLDLHRRALAGQEGTSSQDHSVRTTSYYTSNKNTDHLLDSSRVRNYEHYRSTILHLT